MTRRVSVSLAIGLVALLSAGCALGSSGTAPARPVSVASAGPTDSGAVARLRGLRHLEYIFNDGPVSVYDIDHGFKRVESFTLPGTNRGVRGAAVAPATHTMFVSFGGDGGANGNGSVLAYDLARRKVVWSVNLHSGIDSGAVSNDGKLLYMPSGENSSNGDWHIINTANGSLIGTIKTPGTGPHDGVLSADGSILQLGDRNYSNLLIFDTRAGRVVRKVGPLIGGVRPNTINAGNTLSFTTATGFDGF